MISFALILCVLAAAAQAQPVIRTFDASARSVRAGQPVTLTWVVDKARDVSIDSGLGPVPTKGSRTVTPVQDTTYTLTARDAAGVEREARVAIAVSPGPSPSPPREMGLGRVTGRYLLPTGASEEPGFGLYSYLLFGENENSQNRQRYLAVLRQVIAEISGLDEILANKPDLKRVNVLYIPVRTAMEGAEAEMILRNYDYARAKLLLASIDDRYLKGPYFVSRLLPVQQGKEVGRPYLFQDLSRADPSLALDWVSRFLRQAAREDPWNEDRVEKFAFSFRNEIQALATFAVPVSWKTAR